jgi:UDP-2,4-diacetamido-2,4,6-trideoxy-beta-L-altropyranose hydrolase
MKTAIVRCDGSLQIGWGHVMRTLALARELRSRGWKVEYLCRDLEGTPFSRIEDEGFQISKIAMDIKGKDDSRALVEHANRANSTWAVVDHYGYSGSNYQFILDAGLRVLAIDDIAKSRFPVHVLLNQNTNAKLLRYKTLATTRRLFGPRFALVRQVYKKNRPTAPRVATKVGRVLIAMGGGKGVNATSKTMAACIQTGLPINYDVVLGGSYPLEGNLRKMVARHDLVVNILTDIPDLVEPILKADLVIAAGGSTTWEVCCLGVPMALVSMADNQRGIASSMENIGAAIYLGHIGEKSTHDLAKRILQMIADTTHLSGLAKNAHALVDGDGARRVSEAMENTIP